jgi:heme exporter protein D
VSTNRVAVTVDPDTARREAQHILSGGRFKSSSTPRPLRGPLKWLADRLDTVFGPIGRFLARIPTFVWWIVAAALVAFVVWMIVRVRQRRIARAPEDAKRRAPTRDTREDPDALEREADEAERGGDLERAVRLRFRAGLLRLGDRGAIRYRPSVTTGEVRRTLRSARFEGLAGTFEEVTYGGRAADPPDVTAARREWPRVLEESVRR